MSVKPLRNINMNKFGIRKKNNQNIALFSIFANINQEIPSREI